jgi:SAM-dependent methyltransferase
MMNDDQRQNGGLRVVRQGLGAGTLSCRWCDEDMGPPTLAIEGKGETDASLRYHRCPSCGSLMSEGSADAFLQMRGNQDLVDRTSRRGQIECTTNFDMQCSMLRRLANCDAKRVLDVGCGLGIGPDYAIHMLGAEAIGVDPSPEALSAARHLGHPLVHDYFRPGHPAVSGPFDLVQAWELIEHVDQPLAMLQGFRDLLSNQGFLCLSTPAAEAAGPDAGDKDLLRLLAPPEHLHLFSAKALKGLLRRAGFHSIHVERTADQLIATAGFRDPEFRSPEQSNALFSSYLARRAESLDDANPFRLGFQSRRLSFALGRGDWSTVKQLCGWFIQRFKTA